MYGEQLIQAFLEAANSWICEGFSIDIRYIALRRADQLEIVEATIALGPVQQPQGANFTIATPNLVAGLHQASAVTKKQALTALKMAAGGLLEVDNLSLGLAAIDDLDAYSEMTHRDRWYSPLHLRVAARRASAPGAALVVALDAELRCAEPPFDGTEDLAKALGLNADFTGARAPAITLKVLPPVDLDSDATSLSDNTLAATINAHSNLDLSKIGLALRAAPGEGLASRRQSGNMIEWDDPVGHKRIGKASIVMPNSDGVLAMLSLDSITVRRQWVIDPRKARNARFLAISQFDADLRKVKDALFDSPESRKFEQAVGVLLHMLGFLAGAPIETEAPDLVVATPTGQSMIVECTLKIADFATKVGKLVERRETLSKALAAANLPASVLAALVCRLPRDAIAAPAKDLRNFNVLLFSAEDLEAFLFKAKFLSDPDALLREAVASLTSTGAFE